MKFQRLVIVLTLGLGLTLGLASLLGSAQVARAVPGPEDREDVAAHPVPTDTRNRPDANILYVDADAPGAGTGVSWTDAYTEVQSVLAAALPGDEIWVAEGVYYPDYDPTARQYTGIVSDTFALKSNVALYGGFGGYGISETLRTQRDWTTYPTVLSGDIDRNDTTDTHNIVTSTAGIIGTNAWTVVSGRGVTETALLDGFVITGGEANGPGGFGDPSRSGAGMYNGNSSPTVRNVIFSGNAVNSNGGGMYNNGGSPIMHNVTFAGNAANFGGGMGNNGSSPTLVDVIFVGNTAQFGGGMDLVGSSTLVNVTFIGNFASSDGGGMYSDGPSTLVNVIFSGNTAGRSGGGMATYDSFSTLINVTFSGNTAGINGGGMDNDGFGDITPTIHIQNSIFWHNRDGSDVNAAAQIRNAVGNPIIYDTLIAGGCPPSSGGTCDNILDADPQFVDLNGADDITGTLDDDLRLLSNSPAINAGDNTALPADAPDLDDDGNTTEPVPYDLDSNPRVIGSNVDMGAYEAQGIVTLTLSAQPNTLYANGLDQATLTVTATDASGTGTPFAGWVITCTSSLGSINPVTVMLDAEGLATTTYTAGIVPGTDTVTATVANLGDPKVVTTTLTLQSNPLQGKLSSRFSSQLITYTFVVSSAFPSLQEGVVLTGTVPVHTILLTATGGVSVELGGQVYVISPPTDLAEGERYTIAWTVEVPMFLLGEIVAEARAKSDTARLALTAMNRIYRVLLPWVFQNAALTLGKRQVLRSAPAITSSTMPS